MSNKPIKYIVIFFLLLLLFFIRLYEKSIFDDGLIFFFHNDYLTQNLPEINLASLLLKDGVRFWLNAFISISILYIFFKNESLIKFLFLFYGIVYIILVIGISYEISNYHVGEYLRLFYVRRFLIQPLLLFILFPALLYQFKRRR